MSESFFKGFQLVWLQKAGREIALPHKFFRKFWETPRVVLPAILLEKSET